MYTSFYSLREKPFQIYSDPSFIWLGENHKKALAVLTKGIHGDKGSLLLTGDVGTGKTTLLNSLISSLNDEVIYASVPDPMLEKLDFFNYVAASFGINEEFASKGAFIIAFIDFLHKSRQQNKKVLLIIDESQLLTQELLEEVRLLANIKIENKRILKICFVGQNEFNEIIERPENRAVFQLLTLKYHLESLRPKETKGYIQYHLEIAGTTEKIFTDSALKEIHSYSEGFPRKINLLCDYCLLNGYEKKKKIIDDSDVRDCIKEISIPEYSDEQDYFTGNNEQYLYDFLDDPSETLAVSQPEPKTPNRLISPIGAASLILLTLLIVSFFFSEPFIEAYHNTSRLFASSDRDSNSPILETSEDMTDTIPPRDAVSPEDQTDNSPLTGPIKNSIHEERPTSQNGAPNTITSTNTPEIPEAAKKTFPVDRLADAGLTEEATSQPASAVSMSNNTNDTALTNTGNLLDMLEEPLVVRFAYNSNDFNPLDLAGVERFVSFLNKHPSAIAEVTGYTDAIGSQEFNYKLAKYRANIVKSFLLGMGVPALQIEVKGLGIHNPRGSNDTEEGRRMNRRVEVNLIMKQSAI